jgi:glycosyltransferase involved in cell wall biosynthesis
MADPTPALPPVSAITTCKDLLANLKQTLPRLMAEPFAEVIVVDYDCPDRTGDWVEAACPGVKVVRVTDAPIFHAAGARNAGGAAASSPWLFFIDADVRIAPGFLARVGPLLAEGALYLGEPITLDLWGTMFVTRADFDAVGGYDEAIQGWGSEDEDIVERLELLGCRHARFDGALMDAIPHDNEVRTRHHRIKDPELGNAINFVYRAIKRDLARLGLTPELPARRNIHSQVAAAMLAPERPGSIDIRFRQETHAGRVVTTSLKYAFEEPPAVGEDRH